MSTNLDPGPKPLDAPRPTTAVDIRYGQIGLMQLRIRTTDTGAILDELTGRIASAPNFFRRTAVCLDISELAEIPAIGPLKGVLDAIRRAGMLSVGLAGNSPEMEAVSTALNLPLLSAFRAATQPASPAQSATPPPTPTPAPTKVAEPAPPPAPPAAAEVGLASMIHSQPVRSGQRIYARNRDLVITTGVGAGAEVIADGCLHIYGSLRGRAMAGAHGQLGARVFCQEFHAELVSIAGVFRVFETIPTELSGKPVQAWLDGDDLHFALVGG